MKGENIQFDFHDKLDELRKELDPKIDKKLSTSMALWIAGILLVAIGGTYCWLMSMNERLTRVETKIEMIQSATTQQNLPQTPIKK